MRGGKTTGVYPFAHVPSAPSLVAAAPVYNASQQHRGILVIHRHVFPITTSSSPSRIAASRPARPDCLRLGTLHYDSIFKGEVFG